MSKRNCGVDTLPQQASPLRFVAARDAEFDNMRFYRTELVKVELQS
jgi:hypothetical protein